MAKRKTLFDDRPVEINELTYVIKQDLSSLNSQISSLQSLSKSQSSQSSRSGAEQEGEHNKNVGGISINPVKQLTRRKGCGPITRQARRRRNQFQRSPGSSNEKPPSFKITNRKLCLIGIRAFSTTASSSTVRISSVQYSYQIADTSAWLPKLKSRHIKSRSFVLVHSDASRTAVRPTAFDDGRSATDKYIHQYAGGSYRYD